LLIRAYSDSGIVFPSTTTSDTVVALAVPVEDPVVVGMGVPSAFLIPVGGILACIMLELPEGPPIADDVVTVVHVVVPTVDVYFDDIVIVVVGDNGFVDLLLPANTFVPGGVDFTGEEVVGGLIGEEVVGGFIGEEVVGGLIGEEVVGCFTGEEVVGFFKGEEVGVVVVVAG